MRKFMTTLTAVATVTLAAVPALGLLQAAHAESAARIQFGDLNLSDPAQAAVFNTRIDAQGEALCRQVLGREIRSNIRKGDCLTQVHLEVRRQLTPTQRADLRRATSPSAMQVASR
jgi:UrcA family protein